ncbi:MAG TPA: response regulator [Thermomicrobiales bacterium]|nr:response regulator [Thermomicrobiales bacterium]
MHETILVAEDEPDLLALLAAILEEAGYRVLRARDGAAALAQVERERPDLLLTDDRLPRLRGVDLLARLRAQPAPALPAILMSAARPAALPPGVAFLPKPFDLARLLAAVARLLPA